MASDSAIAKNALPGRYKQKERTTRLFCCSADGTEKYPLKFIGHAQYPPLFKKKYGHQYGSDYRHNSRAWMTSDLFFSWLHRFEKSSGKQPGRKAALRIDNC